ncbi:4Fe-4S dicluster domain-containing protein [Thermodesulfobacteriota bacterium]
MRGGQAQEISREEALEKLTAAQQKDFVLLVEKFEDKVSTIHNCHPCHCLYLKTLRRSDVEAGSVASSYQVILDEDNCTGCSECENACPMFAISMENNDSWELKPNVQENECIGCGICVVGCPGEALTLTRHEY